LYRTGTGEFRRGSVTTKAFEKVAPQLAAAMTVELARLSALDAERRAFDIAERSLALLTLARATVDKVERAKADRGLLDFSDLVTRAAGLLASEYAPWVRFKLDRGIDH